MPSSQSVHWRSCVGDAYLTDMLRKHARRLEVSRFAHNQALHYLARAQQYRLSDLVRQQLTQVVEGYTGRCDDDAARRGIDWMRNQVRARGETPWF